MIDLYGVFIFDVRMKDLKRHLKAPIFKLTRNKDGVLEWQFSLKLIQRELLHWQYGTDNFFLNEKRVIKKLAEREGYRIIRRIVVSEHTKTTPLPFEEGDL